MPPVSFPSPSSPAIPIPTLPDKTGPVPAMPANPLHVVPSRTISSYACLDWLFCALTILSAPAFPIHAHTLTTFPILAAQCRACFSRPHRDDHFNSSPFQAGLSALIHATQDPSCPRSTRKRFANAFHLAD